MTLLPQTEKHLKAHHRDFEEFADLMIETYPNRFDDVFWAFLNLNTQPKKIVDLGSGPGLLLEELALKCPAAEIVGVEAQPSMLKRAHERLKGSKIRLVERDLAGELGDCTELHGADLLVTSMVLHELQLPYLLMKKVFEFMESGGQFVIYDWIRQPLESYLDGELPIELTQVEHFSEHCRYTAEDWVWQLTQAGFKLEEWILRHNSRHVLIRVRKP